jgi:hypothetical protein
MMIQQTNAQIVMLHAVNVQIILCIVQSVLHLNYGSILHALIIVLMDFIMILLLKSVSYVIFSVHHVQDLAVINVNHVKLATSFLLIIKVALYLVQMDFIKTKQPISVLHALLNVQLAYRLLNVLVVHLDFII